MEVIAWSQNLTPEQGARPWARCGVTRSELLSASDVVSIHLVLSDRTRGLIGAAELAQMKPTALLVNTSRGPIVDEQALVAALRERRIAGAGLDVYDQRAAAGRSCAAGAREHGADAAPRLRQPRAWPRCTRRSSRTSPRTCAASRSGCSTDAGLAEMALVSRYTAAKRRMACASTHKSGR